MQSIVHTIKFYSFQEFFLLVKSFLGYKFRFNTKTGLLATNFLIYTLYKKNIEIKKENKFIVFNYTINNNKFSFHLKKHSSDSLVFKQIILNEEYRIITKIFNQNNIIPSTIIDAGANIGLTSMFFSAHFPYSNIIALEPFGDTFKRLARNISTNNLTNVKCLKKGLWGYTTLLSSDISFRDKLDWAFRLVDSKDKNTKNLRFEAISISDILRCQKITTIDLLKIDIEGGEVSIFADTSDVNWLNQVKVIALEIHDEFNCRANIENTLLKFGFKLFHSGELTIGINKTLTIDVTKK